MPTIFADRALRAAAVLALLGAGAGASASGTIEIDPKYENFESRSACEAALQRRHGAAVARFAALPEKERRSSRVDGLRRDDDQHLTYFEVLDLSVELPDMVMPRSQTEEFICRDKVLEHRFSYEAGSYTFLPPPGPTPPPPVQGKPKSDPRLKKGAGGE